MSAQSGQGAQQPMATRRHTAPHGALLTSVLGPLGVLALLKWAVLSRDPGGRGAESQPSSLQSLGPQARDSPSPSALQPHVAGQGSLRAGQARSCSLRGAGQAPSEAGGRGQLEKLGPGVTGAGVVSDSPPVGQRPLRGDPDPSTMLALGRTQ